MVDGSRAQLDCELDRAGFGELVAVQAQREPRAGACLEIPARLRGIEGSPFEEDVGRLRDCRRLWQNVGEEEIHVGARGVELWRHGVRAEPRRNASRGADGP